MARTVHSVSTRRARAVFPWIALAVGCVSEEAERLLVDADTVSVLELVEELRIGSVEDPEIGFSRVDEIDVDRDGRIYVFETLPPEIRVYAPGGEFLHKIGGPGEGPGEFRGPRFSFGVHGDTVWVIDLLFARRITLFTRAGEILSTGAIDAVPAPLEESGMSASLVPFEMDSDGLFASEIGPISLPPSSDPLLRRMGPGAVQVPWARFDGSGMVVDTVGWGRAGRDTSPDSPTIWWLKLAEGEVEVQRLGPASSDEGIFRVIRTNVIGDTLAERSFRFRPIVSDSIDALLDPVTFVRVGSDGAVWLRREDRSDDPMREWILLGADLEPVGQLELPDSGFRVEWSGGDRLLAVVADDLGVPWVIQYRMIGSP
jgi:hypothetical protein